MVEGKIFFLPYRFFGNFTEKSSNILPGMGRKEKDLLKRLVVVEWRNSAEAACGLTIKYVAFHFFLLFSV